MPGENTLEEYLVKIGWDIDEIGFNAANKKLNEFASGIVVERGRHLNAWDYSGQQYNFLGQICLFYTNLWILLSAPMILLHDIMRYLLLDIPLTHYRIF